MMIWSQYDGNKKIQVQSMKSYIDRIRGKFKAIIARSVVHLVDVSENDIAEFQKVIDTNKPFIFPDLPPLPSF